MQVRYTCAKCGTTGHEDLYRIGRGKDDGLYACLTCWKEWAEDYKRRLKNEKANCQSHKLVAGRWTQREWN